VALPSPVTPVYFPNVPYSAPFNRQLSLEQVTYLAQRQGGVVYVPHIYEPTIDNQINTESLRRRNTAPVIQRPIAPPTVPVNRIPAMYDHQDAFHIPQNDLRSPYHSHGLELRTERAWSEPHPAERIWNNFSEDIFSRFDKLDSIQKPRNSSLPIPMQSTSSTLFSHPPSGLLRTENWSFKSPSNSTVIPSQDPVTITSHTYFSNK